MHSTVNENEAATPIQATPMSKTNALLLLTAEMHQRRSMDSGHVNVWRTHRPKRPSSKHAQGLESAMWPLRRLILPVIPAQHAVHVGNCLFKWETLLLRELHHNFFYANLLGINMFTLIQHLIVQVRPC